MGISKTISAILVFLTGLLPASCHKTTPPPKPATTLPIAVAMTNTLVNSNTVVISNHRNLGEISLTNHNETSLQLTTGENCTLTPKLLARNTLQITFAVESKNDYGETRHFAVTQVVAQPGMPTEAVVGDLTFSFTPHFYEE